MLTRNRGKSKSVVEILGLTKRTKRRAADSKSSSDQNNNDERNTTRTSRIDMFVNQSRMGLKSGSPEHSRTEDTIPCRFSSSSPKHDAAKLSDCLPDANNKAYKLTDHATQQILREISSTGRLFMSREKYKHFSKHVADKSVDIERACDTQYILNDPKQAALFALMVGAFSDINEDLDKKDAFLASQRLLRPNVRSFLRQRRERLTTARSFRCVRSYLRPNPRRTRYASSVTTSRRRTGVDRNARVAAKKLAQAKSHAAAAKQVLRRIKSDNKITEVRRGRPKKSQTQDSPNTTTASPTVTIQTRHKQFGNISKHIDWKYCYSSTEKTGRSSRPETVASRKRRAQTTQAVFGEHEMPENDNKYVGVKTETQEDQNRVEESLHSADPDDTEPETQFNIKREITSRSRSSQSGLHNNNKFARRRGTFATPKLSRVSSEPEPQRARNVRRVDNPQLSVLERLVLGFEDFRVTVGDDSNSIRVSGLSEKEFKVLLLRVDNARFVTENVSTNIENNEPKYGVHICFPSSKPPAMKAADLRSIENCEQSQQPSNSNLENGNQNNPLEEGTNDDLSFSGDEVDWNTDYRRRTTQEPYRRPSHLDRFRSPRSNPVRSRPSYPLSTSTERLSGGAEGEGNVESTKTRPAIPPYRRHRKFVRKVYTGSSTVPKILNRRPLITRPQAPANTVSGGPIPQPQMHTQSFLSSLPASSQPIAIKVEAQAAPVFVAENAVPCSISPPADNGTQVVSTEATSIVMNKSGAPSPQVSGNQNSLESSSDQFNPASSMSASQLLRLKRNQDENQHQPARPLLTTSITPVTVTSSPTITSVAMPAPIVQLSSCVQQQHSPLQHPRFKNQCKLNPAEGLRVETGGPANGNVDLDDGADFELSTTSLPTQLPPPQQQVSMIPSPPAHPPIQTLTVFDPTTQPITPRPLPGFFSPQGFIPSIRTAAVSLVRPVAPAPFSRSTAPIITTATTDGIYLTGRPLVTTPLARRNIYPPSSSTNGNSESRRPIVHKCHSIRRLSPKRSSVPESNEIASAGPATARPSTNSQLLKSLLQNSAHSSGGSTSSLISSSSSQLQSRLNPVAASSRVPPVASPVGPAHQSRGTWQLGGKAIVVGASVIKPTSPASQNSTPQSASQPTDSKSIPPQDSNESAQFH